MKAVVFDFDGTLTKSKKGSNCWRKIWEQIDDLEYDDVLYGKFINNQIDHIQWFDLIFRRFVEKNVNQQTMQIIADSISLMNDCFETLETLNSNNIKIFILSGGVRQILEKVLEKQNLKQFITSIETYDLIFNEEGKLVDYKYPKHNLENKNEYIEMIKQNYNFKSEDILFVGNGRNDEDAHKSGAITLCLNPDGTDFTNKTIWNYSIVNSDTLKDILKYVL